MQTTKEPDVFDPYLEPGETVTWAGRPNRSRTFSTQDPALVAFTLPFLVMPLASLGAVAGWWLPGTDVRDGLLVTALFLPAGLYLAAGRFVHRWLKKRRTYYAVTSARVVQLETRRREDRLLWLGLEEVAAVYNLGRLREDGSGTIVFDGWWGLPTPLSWRRDPMPHAVHLLSAWDWPGRVVFFDVDEAAELATWIESTTDAISKIVPAQRSPRAGTPPGPPGRPPRRGARPSP